ncbi:MAG: cell division protein FtsH, partial [Methylococcaceae bacterium]|nr:cell division protein FtsH [Methylococcaceae bacterium]
PVSNEIAHLIDEEIRAVIDRNYQRAEKLLQDNIEILHKMADALMKWETIYNNQIDDLMAVRDSRPPMDDYDLAGRDRLQKTDKGDDKTLNIGDPIGQI